MQKTYKGAINPSNILSESGRTLYKCKPLHKGPAPAKGSYSMPKKFK